MVLFTHEEIILAKVKFLSKKLNEVDDDATIICIEMGEEPYSNYWERIVLALSKPYQEALNKIMFDNNISLLDKDTIEMNGKFYSI